MNDTVRLADGKIIRIRSYNGSDDGKLLRDLTEKNFRNSLDRTIGCDAVRHKRQPEFPERYFMVEDETETIGFFSVRDQPDALYLETIQFLPANRNKGIGIRLIEYVERMAYARKKDKIRFRVFKDNPAIRLYERMGYKVVEDQDWCLLMEKEMDPNNAVHSVVDPTLFHSRR